MVAYRGGHPRLPRRWLGPPRHAISGERGGPVPAGALRVGMTVCPVRDNCGDDYLLRDGRERKLADLLGRRSEREAVENLLFLARAGRSGTLVVRGEAGIGKTALLEYARGTAGPSGFRVESSI